MLLMGTMETAVPSPNRIDLDEGYLERKLFFRSPEHERPSPHAYFIQQSPNSFARSHFHHNSEFQLIVGGSGRLGRHDVRPFVVHYAGQQTGYGPIVAGEAGLAYITLRAVTHSGIWYLPDSRAVMDARIPKGQVSSAWLAPAGTGSPVMEQGGDVQAVLEPKPSGLAAWRVKTAPGMSLPQTLHANGAGRFYMVAGGSMRIDGRELPELSVVWLSQDDPVLEAVAGAQGADVLVMQFPANAWEFPDPPPLPD